jgi:hypothetical protein
LGDIYACYATGIINSFDNQANVLYHGANKFSFLILIFCWHCPGKTRQGKERQGYCVGIHFGPSVIIIIGLFLFYEDFGKMILWLVFETGD